MTFSVHSEVGAVVPALDQVVDVEAVVLADGDEGLGGDEGGELAADQLRRRPVEPHGVGGEEQVIGVPVQFGPLMALDGVLDRERVQPELLGQDGQVSVVGVVQVEPDRHPLLPEELTDLGDSEALHLQRSVAVEPRARFPSRRLPRAQRGCCVSTGGHHVPRLPQVRSPRRPADDVLLP